MNTLSSFLFQAATIAMLASSSSAQVFTTISLPDTQNYADQFPEIFYQQTQWIADSVEALDIRYVSHYGDLVCHGDDLNEWAVADRAMATLDAINVPYGVTAGNHDVTPDGIVGQPYIPSNYQNFFGPQRYAGRAWYRGASPSGMSSYQVFEGGGLSFLALHVECDAPVRELEWAQGVLADHRDKPVLMTTHRYIQDAEAYTSGVPVVPSGRYPDIWYTVEDVYVPGGIRSEDLWQWFIRRNPNIFMVQCGHFHEEFRRSSTNLFGETVHEILADYQDDPNGGDGWLRIMNFDVGNDSVFFQTWSPFRNEFDLADESQFTLSVDFDKFYRTEPTVVLQQGIHGYTGTVDTWIDEGAANASFGSGGVLVSDDDTGNGFFSDDRGQALLRFDGLFGPAPGQVPRGAQILSARLTLELACDIDNPILDPDFEVRRVLVPWDESSTWNSLGEGLSGSELGSLLAILEGDNQTNDDFGRSFEVTQAVQAWSSGAPNHGFAILPEIISGNDDGIEIFSSEAGNVLLRPVLEVVYDGECNRQVYGLGAAPANVLDLQALNLPRIGSTLEFGTVGMARTASVTALGTAAGNLPILGGVLLLDPTNVFVTANSDNGLVSLPVPADLRLVGTSLFAQAFALDMTQPAGLAFSNGVQVTFCR